MNDKKELSSQETEKVSGGWGKDTDNFIPSVILTDSELKKLQRAYPDLKIKRLNVQSVAVPKDSRAYFISSDSGEWIDSDGLSDMITAELGDVSYITHEGKLFKKS